ncbi:hypothetical protein PV04_08308 [Phialophora macrospora]|uniref:Uncharacterized protein n=1 Tax=Phialophora macrospora TaxID=1851006 RepID=A0A0D2G1Z1_9EURO|nr:hypothetical protein PV04_08308 [Phialophora macrospora]
MPEAQEPPASGQMDVDAAMREMMGFSSFNTRPKNRSENNAAQFQSQKPTSSTMSTNNQDFSVISRSAVPSMSHPLKLPQDPEQQMTSVPAPDTVSSIPSRQQAIFMFTSPQTGISFTKQELDEWARGKINEQGDKVYFKPGFVDDDPWSRLRKNPDTKSSNTEAWGKTVGQKRK